MIVAALHLRAKNDPNGNPRRIFVGLNENGHHVAVSDEGYVGRPEWVRELNARGVFEFAVETSISEYNAWNRLDGLTERA